MNEKHGSIEPFLVAISDSQFLIYDSSLQKNPAGNSFSNVHTYTTL